MDPKLFRNLIDIFEEYKDDYWNEELTSEESNDIMQAAWKMRYPDVPLYVFEMGPGFNGPYWSSDKNVKELAWNILPRDDPNGFILTTRGNEITTDEGSVVSIDFAKSGRYKGVIKPYIKGCFEAMENKWLQAFPGRPLPPRLLRLYSRDGSGGTWKAIAQSLGAGLEYDPFH